MSDKNALLYPTYFPTLAAFSVLLQNQVCWEFGGNYQKQSLRNRTYITNDRGLHQLTIPVQGKSKEQPRRAYFEILIDNSQPWQRTHWRTLQTAYRTSPYFEFYEHALEPLFTKLHSHLLPFNILAIKTVCECLQIPFPETESKVFVKNPLHCEDYRYLATPKAPTTYLFPKYNQVFIEKHGFIPNLSILDLLFNEGPNALKLLKEAAI